MGASRSATAAHLPATLRVAAGSAHMSVGSRCTDTKPGPICAGAPSMLIGSPRSARAAHGGVVGGDIGNRAGREGGGQEVVTLAQVADLSQPDLQHAVVGAHGRHVID